MSEQILNPILNNVRKNLWEIKPYVPGKPIADVKRELGLSEVTKLASNENPLGASPKAKQAIADALSDLHRYPDGGAVDLRAALAAKNGLPAEQILVGNGSDEVIKLLVETFLEPGDEVVIPTPTFSQYWFGTQVMGASAVLVPLTEAFEYDFDAMRTAVTERTKLVFLCSPNNPTGTYIKRDALEQFLASIPPHVLVVLDEAYYEYVEADDYASGIDFLKAGHNVLVMRTFSKLYALAALRLGYALGKPDVIEAVNRAREPFNANHLAQVAAVAALNDEEHIEASKRVNREGIAQLTEALGDLGYAAVPTQTNFFVFDTGLNDKELFDALLQEGVITRSGTALGLPGYLRVSVGTKEENVKFLTAFKRVVPLLRQKV